MPRNVLTLVVHGTYAADADWWRLGQGGQSTFADLLEYELAERGMPGTVWKPALDRGFEYSAFAWSGENRHWARLQGGKSLSRGLNRLAQRIGATASDPLVVNLVAHSHGGNVVLEAIRRFDTCVRAGRIALLGTPLVRAMPAFRIGRFVLSILIVGFVLNPTIVSLVAHAYSLIAYQHLFDLSREITRDGQVVEEFTSGRYQLAILLPFVVISGWYFWFAGNLMDFLWRTLCRVLNPLAAACGRDRSLVYGPSALALAKILTEKPILAITTVNDEADVALQLSSAPERLYREYVSSAWGRVGRLLERLLLRPFVMALILKSVEMILEVFTLGFPFWEVLVEDFSVAPPDRSPYYPQELLVQQTVDLQTAPVAAAFMPTLAARTSTVGQSAIATRGLRVSVFEIIAEIKRQIRLRHSQYYANQMVVGQVAAFLTGDFDSPTPHHEATLSFCLRHHAVPQQQRSIMN
jgi:hypothetical protein